MSSCTKHGHSYSCERCTREQMEELRKTLSVRIEKLEAAARDVVKQVPLWVISIAPEEFGKPPPAWMRNLREALNDE